MFDINDPSSTEVKRDGAIDRMVEREVPQSGDQYAEAKANPLDADQMVELHGILLGYYRQELERQAHNRAEQAMDAAYYDGKQLSDEQKAVLNARGQAPIAYNVIAQSVNWVIGSEKRGRTDFSVLPRNKADAKAAESKTKYLKYLSDVNLEPFSRSQAFADAIKVGIGWIERGAQDADDKEIIYQRRESWRNMLWDSAGTAIDNSDWRYCFRSRWTDEDVANAMFPDRGAVICNSVTDAATLGGSYDMLDGDVAMDQAEAERTEVTGMMGVNGAGMVRRRRVRLIESWYRSPQMVSKVSGGMFHGEIYDPENAGHLAQVAAGAARINRKLEMRVRVAVMTTNGLLFEGPSPYKHNRFPFTPIWCYRYDSTGLPYGMIRNLRDIQDDINKRASKALAILSSNKVVMDENALPEGWTIEDFRNEVADPNAILLKKHGTEMEIAVDRDLAPAHLELMHSNIQMVQQVAGVTDEQMGRHTNATSGKAILARQDQGSMTTAEPFDNLRLASQLDGELALSLMEQFVTEPMEFRITNLRGNPEFVSVNDGLPENDITRSQADFVISEQDWRATIRQAQHDQLVDMVQKLPPQVSLVILDLVVDGMDNIQNRDEIVKRIRAMTGQKDPDQAEPTPEDLQAEQQKQQQDQMAQQAQQLQLAEQQAKVGKLQAEQVLLASKAKHADAGANLVAAQTVAANMTGAGLAMTAATAVIQMPTIAKVADGLLLAAGWTGGQPVPTDIAQQGIIRPPMPQAANQPNAQPPVPAPAGIPPAVPAQPMPAQLAPGA